jgi:hypothetical protein
MFFAIFALIELVSITMGFTIFSLLDISIHMIWLSFTLLPIVIATFLVFLVNFLGNHCHFYSRQQEPAVQNEGDVEARMGTNPREPLLGSTESHEQARD